MKIAERLSKIQNRASDVQILREILVQRIEKNPLYSLRAFASALGLHPSAASRILRGIEPLSLRSAKEIARRLQLSPERREDFLKRVAFNKLFDAMCELDVHFTELELETLRSINAFKNLESE